MPGDPQIGVTQGEQSAVLKERTEVLGGLAGDSVESLVSCGNGSLAEAAKQFLDLGGAFPDDDRLGAVRGTERVDEADQRGIAWFTTEQALQVIAQTRSERTAGRDGAPPRRRTARSGSRGGS